VEERVAYLEGRGEEHASAITEVRLDVRELRAEVRDFRGEMNRRFDQTDARFDTKFSWMIGFQFATLMAMIAALLNVYFR
jgi:hypothetical protein